MGTLFELHEELSAAGHNTWNVLLDLITNFDYGVRIQSSLADAELGRVGLSGHSAELHAL